MYVDPKWCYSHKQIKYTSLFAVPFRGVSFINIGSPISPSSSSRVLSRQRCRHFHYFLVNDELNSDIPSSPSISFGSLKNKIPPLLTNFHWHVYTIYSFPIPVFCPSSAVSAKFTFQGNNSLIFQKIVPSFNCGLLSTLRVNHGTIITIILRNGAID